MLIDRLEPLQDETPVAMESFFPFNSNDIEKFPPADGPLGDFNLPEFFTREGAEGEALHRGWLFIYHVITVEHDGDTEIAFEEVLPVRNYLN